MSSLTTPLDQLLSLTRLDASRSTAVVPDGWQQGRGAFGGLITGLMVRALEAHQPDRPLRSLTSELCGPVMPGEVTLAVESLRVGSAVSTVTVRVIQGGEVQAHGVGVLGKQRVTDREHLELKPPTPTPWKDVEIIPVAPPFGPDFAQAFEFRPTSPLPFTGVLDARVEGWVKPKSPGTRRDASFLAACADAYWPTMFSREDAPRPMATIAYTLQPIAGFEGLNPEAPVFHRANLVVARDGYFVEFREIWGEDGRLLGLNQQTFVIIK